MNHLNPNKLQLLLFSFTSKEDCKDKESMHKNVNYNSALHPEVPAISFFVSAKSV